MLTVYLVVHPQATHHLERVVGGWHDSRLTVAGLRSAASIAKQLVAQIPNDARVQLRSSDLQRAVQTARILGDHLRVEPVLDRRLREKSYGEAEGRPQAWLDERFRPPPASGDRMNHDVGIPGAENKKAFAARIYAAMADALRSDGEHKIVVTHGFAATFVIASWIKMPIEAAGYASFRAPSGSITVLREDDYFHNRQIYSLGDTRHLAS